MISHVSPQGRSSEIFLWDLEGSKLQDWVISFEKSEFVWINLKDNLAFLPSCTADVPELKKAESKTPENCVDVVGREVKQLMVVMV